MRVPCACLKRIAMSAPRVDLFFVDANGFDDSVLYTWPFSQRRPARVVFEAKHLGAERFGRLARWLLLCRTALSGHGA